MVREKDYQIGKAIKREARRLTALLFSTEQDLPAHSQLKTLKLLRQARLDLRNIRTRTGAIHLSMFNINRYSEEQCLRQFRFRKSDVGRIPEVMGWIGNRTARNRYACDSITACCIVLRRLACSSTWYDLEEMFGMRYSALSEVFWEALERFIDGKGQLITIFQLGFLRSRAELYATAIENAGAVLDSCVGFIDCTKIRMARSGGGGANQSACYSGHKRMHCLVYQTVTTPDGLIFSLYGPEAGRRHDLTLLRNSGIIETLQTSLVINGRQFYIYGDAAYMLRPWIQTAYERVGATSEQAVFNTRMSAVPVSVKWNYKDLKKIWTRNDFNRLLKVRRFPVSLLYIASALLLNFKTCMENWGQTQSYFNCRDPSFEEYVNM